MCMEVRADATANRKGTFEATAQAYVAAVCDPGAQVETLEVLGGQAAYVVKDMDPAASLGDSDPEGRRSAVLHHCSTGCVPGHDRSREHELQGLQAASATSPSCLVRYPAVRL